MLGYYRLMIQVNRKWVTGAADIDIGRLLAYHSMHLSRYPLRIEEQQSDGTWKAILKGMR